MNIFVTGTGRCGTVTFSRAAGHCTNYTVRHESKAGRIGESQNAWKYKGDHIEVSSQLVIAIPILKQRYPKAKWVHLVRDRIECINSQAAQCSEAIGAFASVYFQTRKMVPEHVYLAAGAYYDLTVALIAEMLPNAFRLQLEHAKRDWRRCWDFMGCVGDFSKSLKEWDCRYNARG